MIDIAWRHSMVRVGQVVVEHDAIVNATYIRLSDEQIDHTTCITAGVRLDVDAHGEVVGIEIA